MFINEYKKLPDSVDSSQQFNMYKSHISYDITYEYFMHYDTIPKICDTETSIIYNHEHQFIQYNELSYNQLNPIVEKYFSPSNVINHIRKNMEIKYNIDYNNICVLFYRGNDKNRETSICAYDEYIYIAKEIFAKNPNIQFLIQSDETGFIELCMSIFPDNAFYFKDEIRHVKKCNSTVDIIMRDTNSVFSKYYLAITIIMAKCNYIVCGSGNCSLWIMLYRGNCTNVYQNLNQNWSSYF